MRRFMITCFFAIVSPFQARSATIHVPTDQPTIQAGINAAAFAGDIVLVASGTYAGVDNKDLNLKGKAILLRSEEGADSTIIDCENQGRGFYFQAGEGKSTIVEGFTIRNGRVSGIFPDGWGGGILCVGSSPTVKDCVIESNATENGFGGGLACYDASPRLVNCGIQQNASPSGLGGGAYVRESSPRFESCRIESNIGWYGGGVFTEESYVVMIACVIGENNAGAGDGGGASFEATTGTIDDCTFSENLASRGGGFYITGVTAPEFSGCIVSNNFATAGGGIYSVSVSPFINECIVERNTANAGGGMYICCSDPFPPFISNVLFLENRAFDRGGAVFCELSGRPFLSQCVFVANEADSGSALTSQYNGTPTLRNCTLYGNISTATIVVTSDIVLVQNSILAFTSAGEPIECNEGEARLSCTDIYANLGGNWTGCIASQLGQNGNFSANPLFCDATARDFTIRATSPCAPANSPPGCFLIGALPVGCGVADVDVEEASSAALRLTVIPNPVRGMARFELGPGALLTTLRIFDSQGRLIEQLSGQDGAWEWKPGSAVPAGVYFAMPEDGPAGPEAVKFLFLR